LHDPNIYTLLALSAPDAQLAAARWVNAAVNLLAFAVWTVWEVVLPGTGFLGRESSAGAPKGAATAL